MKKSGLLIVWCSLLFGAFGFTFDNPTRLAKGPHPMSAYQIVYKGEKGPGRGKNIVFITTDHEYRSEESLPALARILAKRYGACCFLSDIQDTDHFFHLFYTCQHNAAATNG